MNLRDEGWAFAQRMADEQKRNPVAPEPFPDDCDDLLVDPPDSSIWEGLPATRGSEPAR